MIDLLTFSWSSHPHVLAIGLDLAVKSTLLILLAMFAAAILGRGRILLRTAMWNACLLGLLVLPVTSIALPRLRIAVLPPASNPPAAAVSIATPAPGPGFENTLAGANLPNLATPAGAVSDQPVVAPTAVEPDGVDAKSTDHSDRSAATQVDATSRSVDWLAAGVLVYASGVLALAVRLGCSLVAVRRLRRSGQPITDSAWVETFAGWTRRLEIVCPVRLVHSAEVSVPVAFGWYSPAVMIPSGMVAAAGCSLRGSVILHELAHVRRCDYLWQLLLRAMQIIYWPNPLIWLIARPISSAREDASDALCVHHASDPREYRLTLLEVARSLVRRPVAALGIAMARSSKIGRRLEQIDRGLRVSRCLAGRPIRSTLAAGAILIAGIVGACQLASRDSATAAPVTAATPTEAAATTAQPTTQPTRMRYFMLLVVGKDKLTFQGQPTTWEDLPRLLEQVPNRPTTALEVAAATDEMTLRETNDAESRGAALVKQFGFEYFSYVGVHPLGSKADPPQRLSADGKTQLPEIREATAEGSRVRLKSGAEVELLGIRALAEGNAWWAQKWWGLDGQPLKEDPWDPDEPAFLPEHVKHPAFQHYAEQLKKLREYQFAARMTGPQGEIESPEHPLVYAWHVEEAPFTTGGNLRRGGRNVPGERTMHAAIPADRETVNFRIGIGTGQWETRAVSHGEMSASSRGRVDVAFSAATDNEGAATIFITDREYDRAFRVLAIDHNGQSHIAKCDHSVGNALGDARMTEAKFPGLAPKQIKEYQFQTMEYDWASFKDVPLRPGLKSFKAATIEATITPAGMKGSEAR